MEAGERSSGLPNNSNIGRIVWPQHLAALLATLSVFSGGTVTGWSTPAIPYLQGNGNDNSTLTITDEDGSWLGSLPTLGALIGSIPAGFVADRLGRKKTLLILAVPYIVSWILLICVEDNLPLLCFSRLLSGIGLGASLVIVPVYNEEVSDLKARGTTGTYSEISYCLGMLYSFAVGAYAPYTWYLISACLFDVIFVVSYVWMPESPMFLLMKDRQDEAEKSLKWLRGVEKQTKGNIEKELLTMKLFIEEERALQSSYRSNDTFLKRLKNIAKDFSYGTPSMKAAVISIGVLVYQQLNGSSAIFFYTVNLFQDAGTSMSPYVASIIVGAAQLAAASVTTRVIDLTGRKPLLLFSEICATILLTSMGVYFYFKECGSDISSVSWLPVLILNLFTLTTEVGYGATPWLVMAEVCPPETKGIITSTASVLYWLVMFLVTKLYTNMVYAMGTAWTFWFYAICCITGALFIIFIVPETKMKTREQIQKELRH